MRLAYEYAWPIEVSNCEMAGNYLETWVTCSWLAFCQEGIFPSFHFLCCFIECVEGNIIYRRILTAFPNAQQMQALCSFLTSKFISRVEFLYTPS